MEKSGTQNFLIDGFPRNKNNLDGWNSVMQSVARVQKVLFFNCPDQVTLINILVICLSKVITNITFCYALATEKRKFHLIIGGVFTITI